MILRSKEIFYKSPKAGTLVTAKAFYTHRAGTEMMRTVSTQTRSDTVDTMQRSFSEDNGRTWSEPEQIAFIDQTSHGVHRRYIQPGFVDSGNDRLLRMVLEGILPDDEPLQGMKQWYLRYCVSEDGGHTNLVDEQIIQQGEFTSKHPYRGVWVGKNSIMIGDTTCRPILTRKGNILVPVQITPLGPDGEYYNPGGGYTYHMSAVLIGTWLNDGHITWDLSQFVENDPNISTRGAVEPTLSEISDGCILMVVRGSNDARPELPGYKWYAISTDGGYTWTPLKPWTYSDGTPFYSPSSCSQLLRHSSGLTYWLGNLTQHNPRGNRPRYPFVIGEVDSHSLLLKREAVVIVDARQSGENKNMCLSNFITHEDRLNGDIVIYMSRMFTREPEDWTAHAYEYRIEP
jgi:hypothetical protein